MMNIADIDKRYKSDLFDGLDEWLEESYQTSFAPYFDIQTHLIKRLSDDDNPITDEELQSILIDIPLKLFEVSEILNRFKLRCNAIKLNIKQTEKQTVFDMTEGSATHKREVAVLSTVEDKFLLQAYESLIARVEKELSYSRELIMGAKKIWDGRRSSEAPTPTIPETDGVDLPEYTNVPKAYIQ